MQSSSIITELDYTNPFDAISFAPRSSRVLKQHNRERGRKK